MATILPYANYYLNTDPSKKVVDNFVFSDPDYKGHNETYKFSEGDALLVGFQPAKTGL